MALPLKPSMPTRSHQPLGFSMALPLRPYHLHRFIHQKQIRLNCSSIFNAKPTSPDQPLRFSMALPLRPYHPQRFIHQKFHPNPTKMFKHLHCEAHRTISAAAFSMALPLKPSMRSLRTRSAVEVQHGPSHEAISPAALHPSEASRKSDRTCSSIFNAKPTLREEPCWLIWSGGLRIEGTRSAVQVQHGPSPQAISPAALHPSAAKPKSD